MEMTSSAPSSVSPKTKKTKKVIVENVEQENNDYQNEEIVKYEKKSNTNIRLTFAIITFIILIVVAFFSLKNYNNMINKQFNQQMNIDQQIEEQEIVKKRINENNFVSNLQSNFMNGDKTIYSIKFIDHGQKTFGSDGYISVKINSISSNPVVIGENIVENVTDLITSTGEKQNLDGKTIVNSLTAKIENNVANTEGYFAYYIIDSIKGNNTCTYCQQFGINFSQEKNKYISRTDYNTLREVASLTLLDIVGPKRQSLEFYIQNGDFYDMYGEKIIRQGNEKDVFFLNFEKLLGLK